MVKRLLYYYRGADLIHCSNHEFHTQTQNMKQAVFQRNNSDMNHLNLQSILSQYWSPYRTVQWSDQFDYTNSCLRNSLQIFSVWPFCSEIEINKLLTSANLFVSRIERHRSHSARFLWEWTKLKLPLKPIGNRSVAWVMTQRRRSITLQYAFIFGLFFIRDRWLNMNNSFGNLSMCIHV